MESRVETAPHLRSLRIGEIFDRATTFYVRNFVVFTLILLTLEAPLAVVQYAVSGNLRSNYAAVFAQIEHPGRSPAGIPALSSVLGLGILVFFISLIIAPYINNAVASGVDDLYAGRAPSYAREFGRVLRRWLPLLGTIGLCVLILIGVYLAFIITAVVVGGVFGAALTLAGSRVGVAGALVVIGIITLVTVFVVVLMIIACAFALFATTIEQLAPARAIQTGFARIFARRELGKAVLLMLAYVALELVAGIVSSAIGLLLLLVPVAGTVLEVAFSTIVSTVLSAFLAVLLAVYYFDVRTRAEGLDLEVEVQRLSPNV